MKLTKELPHKKVMVYVRPSLAGKALYSRWVVKASEVPPSWELAIEKLSESS